MKTYVCRTSTLLVWIAFLPGCTGSPGEPGKEGLPSLVVTEPEAAGKNCPNGGLRVLAGLDQDNDGKLDKDEANDPVYVCHGEPGADGADGKNGADGIDGKDGVDGINGEDGKDGIDGEDGKDGIDGEDGKDALPAGTAGTGAAPSGQAGAAGSAGELGQGGISGEPGGAAGAAAVQPPATVLRLSDEPSGDNCPAGGKKIETGLDLNRNGNLDDDEVVAAATAYLCNQGPPSCLGMTGGMCESPYVPGGTFMMGRSKSTNASDVCPTGMTCGDDELEEHKVTVSSFYLDKYEVTVGRFIHFFDAYAAGWRPKEGQGAHPSDPSTGWQAGWSTQLPATSIGLARPLLNGTFPDTILVEWGSDETLDAEQWYQEHPINYISWHVAFAFCLWDGGRLPTEAEWEYVASGGDQERLYPWGATDVSTDSASYCCFRGPYDGVSVLKPNPVTDVTGGAARWGQLGMSGGVSEFVFDAYDATWYFNESATGTDPINAPPPSRSEADVSARGSNYLTGAAIETEKTRLAELGTDSRSAHRVLVPYSTTYWGAELGIRCARDR